MYRTFQLMPILVVFLSFTIGNTMLFAQSGHTARITALAMSSEGKLLSASVDGTLILWDEMARKIRNYHRSDAQYSETKLMVMDLWFLKDSNCFVASSLADGYIGCFDNPVLSSLNTGYISSLHGLELTSDKHYLLSANTILNGLNVLTLTGKKYNFISTITGDIYPLSTDPKKFLVKSGMSGVTILDIDGNKYANFPLLKEEGPMAVAPDGSGFFYSDAFYFLKGEKLFTLTEKAGTIRFSSDSKQLYTCSGNKIFSWSKEGKVVSVIEYKNKIETFILSPDGNAIIVGDNSGGLEMLTLDGKSVLQYK